MFVDQSYFVVVDEVRGGGRKTYEWRLHGNGGSRTRPFYRRVAERVLAAAAPADPPEATGGAPPDLGRAPSPR